jgi:hypothetical protein
MKKKRMPLTSLPGSNFKMRDSKITCLKNKKANILVLAGEVNPNKIKEPKTFSFSLTTEVNIASNLSILKILILGEVHKVNSKNSRGNKNLTMKKRSMIKEAITMEVIVLNKTIEANIASNLTILKNHQIQGQVMIMKKDKDTKNGKESKISKKKQKKIMKILIIILILPSLAIIR